ncbi:MAG: Omp28-related outer membrane protein [Ignavibacteriales bacterium]|nr:MAG: Omp28-related outer membrane protein [Ignavibacteriaceae bacterium]MBW7873119.1 Omp28-related outer membrane protein [Ignavibacteria bacterium]MCZ2142762.1 Omp28-related outer membrane protein [Ignavibacteriales bacterium]OQY73967.1 MAG: hypothetical protein B6D45_07510 [Ignavibacteriales bacterium UTCHB3]MBV6443856.1 hypothetical protein [Ignavibacteriaceae bacterium]
MKNLLRFFLFIIAVLIVSFSDINAQRERNPVLEFATGTWCQWCPCGHTIIHDFILRNNPNTIVIAYHGPSNSSDPFRIFAGNTIISKLGFSAYPTGIVDRLSAPLSRDVWAARVSARAQVPPQIDIMGDIGYDESENKIYVNLVIKAMAEIAQQPMLQFVLTEDGLKYSQTGNGSCAGSANYIHDHVARALFNSDIGQAIGKPGWSAGDSVVIDTSFAMPANVMKNTNTKFIAFVYAQKSPLNTSEILQGREWKVTDFPMGAYENGYSAQPTDWFLGQNFPNPFNPETRISFSVPKSGYVSLKVYDLLGKEVATLVDGEIAAGNHYRNFNAEALPSGVYVCRLEAEGVSLSRKMSLLK